MPTRSNETYLLANDPTPAQKTQKPAPAQKLLDWLQRWNKPTICAREILIYGPRSTRKRKDANDATEILVKHGWLVPTKTKQRDWRRWQIVRQPIIHPTIAK
jgi:hypothetical protein